MTAYEKIQNRINNTPELAQYTDLLTYDWENFDEHADWVATADTAEIIDWAEVIPTSERDCV